jgi:hypothetical protein
MASRITAAKKWSGSPAADGVQVVPASDERHTRARPPGGIRSLSAVSGKTKTVSGSCGWTTIGKPKSAGRPSAMEIHWPPASSDR